MIDQQTDTVESSIEINASREKVWAALTNAGQFSAWFGLRVHFVAEPGAAVQFEMGDGVEGRIETWNPPSEIAMRWWPYGVGDPGHHGTLMHFTLEAIPTGTRLSVVESGFSKLVGKTLEQALQLASEAWTTQLVTLRQNLEVAAYG